MAGAGTAPDPKSKHKKSSSKSTSSSSGGGGGGGGSIKKTNDKPQAAVLEALLKSGLDKQLATKVTNLRSAYANSDAALLASYGARTDVIDKSLAANDAAMAGASQGNVLNRARETSEILSQAAAQGAGETDTLRSKFMTAQNFFANESEAAQSYHDTRTSANSSLSELNSDTKTGRYNLANQLGTDVEATTADNYNQKADLAAQLGNLRSNPYSNAYSSKQAKWAYAQLKKYASMSPTKEQVDPTIQNWEGPMQPKDQRLNSSVMIEDNAGQTQKRPEGSTLQNW
jgi:hypothetical protein